MPMFRQEIEYGTMAKIYSLLPGGCPEPYCYDKANAMSKSINTCNNYMIDHDYNYRPWTTDYEIRFVGMITSIQWNYGVKYKSINCCSQ